MNQLLLARKRQGGFSLIELMVVIAIVLVMSLAIFSVMSTSEGKKRTLTSVNDIDQSGNFAMYQMEKAVRIAGSGFSQSYVQSFGCQLFASQTTNGVILPFVRATMAKPFDAMNATLQGVYRLAPVIIAKNVTTPNMSGATSDVLIVMSGSAGYGEVPTSFTNSPGAAQLNLQNTLSFKANDLVLIADQGASGGSLPCMIEQVDKAFVASNVITALPLAGTYYANPIAAPSGSKDVTSYSNNALAMGIGNPNGNSPSFQLLGVGDNNVLFQYDLLQGGIYDTPIPTADGVFEMHALYGVDTNNDGLVDKWVDPSSADYDYATLESGTVAANNTLVTIKAIRIGLIMRTSLQEKAPVSPAPPATTGSLILFSDLGDAALIYKRTLSSAEQNYRYRTIESTIPLRNSLLLN